MNELGACGEVFEVESEHTTPKCTECVRKEKAKEEKNAKEGRNGTEKKKVCDYENMYTEPESPKQE